VFDFGVCVVGVLWSVPCLAFCFVSGESGSDVSVGDLVTYVVDVGVAVGASDGPIVDVAPCVRCSRHLCYGCGRS
jgi:hypothetical protein